MKEIAGDMYSFLKRFHEEYDPLEYTTDCGINLITFAGTLSRRYEQLKQKKYPAREALEEISEAVDGIRMLLKSMKKEELINLINISNKVNLNLTDHGINFILELMILELKHRGDKKIS